MSMDQDTELSSLPTESGGPGVETPPQQGLTAGDGAPPALPEFEIPEKWPKYAQEALKSLAGLPDNRPFAENWVKHGKEMQGYMTKIEQERAALRDQFSPIDNLLKPYAAQWQMQGLDTQAGLRQLLSWADYTARNPAEGIKKLAELYGVPLESLTAEQPYVAPEVQELRDWKRSQEQAQFGYQQQVLQYQQQQVLDQLKAFESATDEGGQPKYPHYQRVQENMTRAFKGGYAKDLDSAYQFAIRNDPELQAEITAENARKAAATRATEAKKAVEASRTVKAKGTDERVPQRSFADDLKKALTGAGMS